MEMFLVVIIFVLVCIDIRQWIELKRLRCQTIEAFLKLCKKVFEAD